MLNPFLPIINSLLPEPHASLLNGILFGVKASMPREFYQSLVTTGTLHIIALSGTNISILVSLIASVTKYLGKKSSIIFTSFFIWLFVWFVGFSPSVVRAAGMGSVALLGLYFGRLKIPLLSLILISSLMLLFDTSLLLNISFQLSFLATLGIIVANRLAKRHTHGTIVSKLRNAVKENFILTMSAQLFTLPVILINFHRVSLIAPLANILTVFIIPPLMAAGFVTCILGWIWMPLGKIPAWFLWVPLTYFISVIRLLAKIPGASVQF